jgi:hypothetical protein
LAKILDVDSPLFLYKTQFYFSFSSITSLSPIKEAAHKLTTMTQWAYYPEHRVIGKQIKGGKEINTEKDFKREKHIVCVSVMQAAWF